MEVVAAVGGGLISASVESLFEKLGSGELLKFAREEQMLAGLKNWENMLIKINALLDDAEEKQMTDRGLKIWLDELRDLAYDIEDVLDEFSTEALKLKVMRDSQKNTIKLPTCFTGFSPASFAFKRRMASKTNDITSRLQRITEQEQTLNLTKIARERSNKLKERPPTSSLIQESHTSGRNDDKEAIVRKLLTDEVGNNPVRVIPILGMGGIGKTTLAQLVYNDPRVKACFEIKLWVCVSENFDVVALTRTILQAVIGKIRDSGDLDLNDLNNFDVLQKKLKAKLSRKKFLLVLDDVWEEDYSQWDLLRKPFDSGAHGSKIVITTRNECVASITSTDASAYRVKVLLDAECLSVLALHALGTPNFDAHLDLKDIGEKIVKRCKGLPLAAKVLGGLLRSKSSLEEWEGILTSEMWMAEGIPEASNSILLALKLSYHYLPCYLKRCFVYCAIFPKDYEFDREELVSLWMAEGFLQHPRGKKPTEDVGIKYFNDLLSRSFFQSSSGTHSRFVMHDLISDLAQSIAGEICYSYDNKSEDSMLSSKYQKVRHASLNLFEKYDSQYDVFDKMNSLRTIVGLPIPGRDQEIFQHCGYGKYEYKKVLCKILPKAKSVRVLSLTSPTIFVIPDSIGDLKHMRHLNLAHTFIQRLPESVSFLFNLQALILHNCFNLIELPRQIGNLVNLQHLDIYHTPKLREMPPEIGKLTNLQKLSNFIVRNGDGNTITHLKNLSELRGSLSICGLHNVTDIQAARSANMKTKQNLEELVLEWTDHFFEPLVKAADYDEQNDDKNEILVLQSLQPHRNLKKLTISFYGGSEFPYWMGHPMSSKLLCLTLRHCRKVKLLPPLGQFCFLKELSIDGLDGLETIGPQFYGCDLQSVEPFRSLETLEIKNMPEWREWSHFAGAEVRFPNLQRLVLQNCPELIGNLPSRLPCGLTHIRVEDCDALESFPMIDSSTSEQCLLEELEIRNCYSLKYFDRNFNFPSSLTRLTIVNCRSLVFLPDGLMVDGGENECKSQSHLEYLEISGCPLIPSFPTGKFPAALNELRIGGLMHLGSITREMFHENNVLERVEIWNNDNLRALPSITSMQSLRHLSIDNCPALESFPEMGLAIPTLIYLAVQNCPNLLSLPKPELSHLPSLRTFIVSNCRGVVSLTEEGGLPPNLTALQIRDCENLRQPMAEWGLHRLSSLEILQVDGIRDAVANVVSILDDGGCLLPTSLNILWMADFMNLESISMGLQMLTSLNCLLIKDCPKLRSFPKEAVPPGLLRINLCGCPLLKADYLKLKNEEDRPTVEFFL